MIRISFWFWREISIFFVVAGNFDYDRKKKDTVVCLAGARSLLRPEKKDTVVCLVGARSLLRPKKKRYSRLSGGCTIIITTGKKKIQSSVLRVRDHYWVRDHYLLRPEKTKDTVVCMVGARSLLRPKKKIQSSVWRVHDHVCLSCRNRYICISST